MRKLFVLGGVLGLVFLGWADGAFAPAITVTFADTRTIAAHVQSLGKGWRDPILTRAVPAALVNSPAARLFGPMRARTPAVAVCYVDAQVVARILATPANAAGRKKRERDLERAKHWTLYYPASIPQAAFLSKHPGVRSDRGCLVIPPAQGQRGPVLYAKYSADGQWVAFSVSPILTLNTATAAAAALRRPLGNNLAFVKMTASGSRALLQTDACAGAEIAIRMGAQGLEIDGTVRMKALAQGTLNPAQALSFSNVPPTAPLFGVTMLGEEIRTADVFAMAGPELAAFVRKNLVLGAYPGGRPTAFHLPAWTRPGHAAPRAAGVPRDRVAAILPEAFRRRDLECVMFCSLTELMRQAMPRIAASLPVTEALQLEVGVRLLKGTRGQGLGFMSWRQGPDERVFIRISSDELRGTAGLWSTLFL